mmetsp:Transcript_114191/g.271820  ORF Transcript_114191/g.271820 Transcript_114191/m.271820 type:complete len:389 (-) Transcript_114191:123-1289(-)
MEQDRISQLVIGIFKSPTWIIPVAQFVDTNCLEFEDQEENKLEYTLVHNAFKQLVEDLLAAHLAELEISTEEFTSFCEYGLSGSNELHRSLVEQLISVEDFLVFKAMMLKRNSELSREVLMPVGSIVIADGPEGMPAPPCEPAPETEAERLERLEVEQRCVEAELQLAIALSRHLEKRLQLIEALNEVLEMAAQLSAQAESMSAQAEAEAAQQAALQAAQLIQQQQEMFSMPSSLHVQPLQVCAPDDPYEAERRRCDAAEQQEKAERNVRASAARRQAESCNPSQPSQEEREARAEHLRRQREALMEKKRREREEELSRFTASNDSTAARAAERACAGQPALPDAGRKLADELRGQAPEAPRSNAEDAALAMRKALTAQLKQTLTQSL